MRIRNHNERWGEGSGTNTRNAKPKINARRKKRERKNMATLPLTEVVAAMSKTEKKVNISSHCDITH